ncbi:MAG: TauD/TfdA family dioxygenase [Gammaproteobacteria bacterium]
MKDQALANNIRPITSNPAWQNNDLLDDARWQDQFTQQCIDELLVAVATLKKHNDKANYRLLKLPTCQALLTRIANRLECDLGFFRLRGFPLDTIDRVDLEIALLILGHIMGTPVAQNKQGEIIMHVQDQGYKTGAVNRGTNMKGALVYHTDSCDVTALLCVKKAKSGAVSRIVSSASIHNALLQIDEKLVQTLYTLFHWKRQGWGNQQEKNYFIIPVFTQYQGYFSSKWLRLFIEQAQEYSEVPRLTQQQISAFDAIDELTNNPKFHKILPFEPGDIMFVNNHIIYHTRSAFVDFDEPERKRDLLRLWLSVPNSSPLSPLLLPLFHCTEPGAVRGGVLT